MRDVLVIARESVSETGVENNPKCVGHPSNWQARRLRA